jgi:quercetin dioxygenase-like cupin family protein
MSERKISRTRLEDYKGGWFIGAFHPTTMWTDKFEVSVKLHPKGEVWPKHYHAVATEINCVIEGVVEIEGERYVKGDVFVVPPMYVMDPTFLEDCTIVCVKTPSVMGDKYEVER